MPLPDGVTQRDIAEHLGIAVSTVSRALGDNPRVSRVTREAVRRAARELAASQAGADASGPPLMIGVTHSHSYHGLQDHNHESVLEQVLGGVEVACRRHNAVPYPWQQSHLLAGAEAAPFFERVSGVIMSGGEIDDDVIAAITAHGKPIVLIGGHVPGVPISSIAADSLDGMYRATRHLIELGHRRIALVNGPDTTYTSREKKAGYLAALADTGVPLDPNLLVSRDEWGGFTDDAAESLSRSVLGLLDRPTAVIFATDTMARAGYRVCRELGLSIPGDVSLVGFHDDDAAFADPPMTSIGVDRTAWGVAAAELLMRIIAGQEGEASRTLLPVELVVRESTASPRKATTIRPEAG
jgi:LacI family transcriptional regulator